MEKRVDNEMGAKDHRVGYGDQKIKRHTALWKSALNPAR